MNNAFNRIPPVINRKENQSHVLCRPFSEVRAFTPAQSSRQYTRLAQMILVADLDSQIWGDDMIVEE
jgi:hypothetical protein